MSARLLVARRVVVLSGPPKKAHKGCAGCLAVQIVSCGEIIPGMIKAGRVTYQRAMHLIDGYD